MDNKFILGSVLAVILVLGVFLPFGQESRTVVQRVSEPLGALNSPDLQIGDVRMTSASVTSLNQATSSVLCSLQSPQATSSLIYASINVTSATSGATFISLNRSAQQYATTAAALSLTPLPTTIAGGVSMASNTIFAPNTYLIGAQTGGGILNQTGKCQALWVPVL